MQTESMTQPPAGIRWAVADDLDGMLRADHVAAQGDPGRAEFLRSSLMLGQCQVHVADGAVTGFVIVKPAHFFGRDFIERARSVYILNDRRTALKKQINRISGSAIVEEKSYPSYG